MKCLIKYKVIFLLAFNVGLLTAVFYLISLGELVNLTVFRENTKFALSLSGEVAGPFCGGIVAQSCRSGKMQPHHISWLC